MWAAVSPIRSYSEDMISTAEYVDSNGGRTSTDADEIRSWTAFTTAEHTLQSRSEQEHYTSERRHTLQGPQRHDLAHNIAAFGVSILLHLLRLTILA